MSNVHCFAKIVPAITFVLEMVQRNKQGFSRMEEYIHRDMCVCVCVYIIIIISIQPEGRFWQEPEPSQATGMALAHCILGSFLEVGCHIYIYIYIYVYI